MAQSLSSWGFKLLYNGFSQNFRQDTLFSLTNLNFRHGRSGSVEHDRVRLRAREEGLRQNAC